MNRLTTCYLTLISFEWPAVGSNDLLFSCCCCCYECEGELADYYYFQFFVSLFILVQFRLLNTNYQQNEFNGQRGQNEEENRLNIVEDLFVQHIFFLHFWLFVIINIHIQKLHLRVFFLFSSRFCISFHRTSCNMRIFYLISIIRLEMRWSEFIWTLCNYLFNRHKCVLRSMFSVHYYDSMFDAQFISFIGYIEWVRWNVIQIASSYNTNLMDEIGQNYYLIFVSVLCYTLRRAQTKLLLFGWLFVDTIIIKPIDLPIPWFVDRS